MDMMNSIASSAMQMSAAQFEQQYSISSKFSALNFTPSHSSGCNAPQAGQGTCHSSCVLCSYSTAILEVLLFVGVETLISFLFQNVARRFPAKSNGSPSLPAVIGYASISSANRIRMERIRRLEGEFAPTMVTCPPGNIF